jgi:TRAP-type C4-dicarboxylate transport system permease small subunit
MGRDRFGAFVARASGWGAGLCLAGVVCAGALQVFCRYVLNAPLRWPEELSRLLFIWLTYAGALVLPGQRLQIAVGFFYDRMSWRARRALDLLADLLGAGFFGALTIGGVVLVHTMAGLLLPALQLPMNLIFGAIPIAAGLQAYVHLASAIRLLRSQAEAPIGRPLAAPEGS